MYTLKITEEQREMLQSLLCDVVKDSRDNATALIGHNDERALKMLKKSAEADKLWTVINLAEAV